MKNILILFSAVVVFASCSSLMKYKPAKDEFKNIEFENKVTIVETAAEETKTVDTGSQISVSSTTTAQSSNSTDTTVANNSAQNVKNDVKLPLQKTTQTTKQTKSTDPKNSKNLKQSKNAVPVVTGRQPEIEDREGFDGRRRPLVDPFRTGEVVEHEVGYLGATAGTLKFMVKPFAVVNGRKSYNFFIDLRSTTFFSRVYAVDDKVQTYVDFEELVPHVFKMNIRDSGQVKEAQSYFDNTNLKADYWEHRYTEKGGHEEKKLNWSILPYSQNPFSAVFYMRVFKWTIGKEISFRVADDEKNVIFKARAVEKTVLDTEAGKFNAIKLKAEVYSRGNLAKATDFYMWISDDDRKYILRIEVKLPIGSLVSEVVDIEEGKP